MPTWIAKESASMLRRQSVCQESEKDTSLHHQKILQKSHIIITEFSALYCSSNKHKIITLVGSFKIAKIYFKNNRNAKTKKNFRIFSIEKQSHRKPKSLLMICFCIIFLFRYNAGSIFPLASASYLLESIFCRIYKIYYSIFVLKSHSV